jgi:hypothetical protein
MKTSRVRQAALGNEPSAESLTIARHNKLLVVQPLRPFRPFRGSVDALKVSVGNPFESLAAIIHHRLWEPAVGRPRPAIQADQHRQGHTAGLSSCCHQRNRWQDLPDMRYAIVSVRRKFVTDVI